MGALTLFNVSSRIEVVNENETGVADSLNVTVSTSENVRVINSRVKWEVMVFLLVAFISVITNLRVLCITVESPRRKLSCQLNILFIQMCAMGLSLSFLVTILVVDRSGLINLEGPIACHLFSFCRSTIVAAYTFTMIGIIYVIVSAFHNSTSTLIIWRAVSLIWTIAAMQGIPNFFSVEFVVNPLTGIGKCKRINLMKSVATTVGLEVVRFILVHLLVSVYICFELYRIRSKVRFLYILKKIPRKGIRGAVRQLRFVYLFALSFVLTWLPSGIIMSVYRVLVQLGVDVSSLPCWITLLTVTHVNNVLIPIFFLYLNENLNKVYSFVFVFLCKTGCEPESGDEPNENSEMKEKVAGENVDVAVRKETQV